MPSFNIQHIEVPRNGCLSVRKKFYDNSVAARAPGPGAHEMQVMLANHTILAQSNPCISDMIGLLR
jgi:hypothetical protein